MRWWATFNLVDWAAHWAATHGTPLPTSISSTQTVLLVRAHWIPNNLLHIGTMTPDINREP